MIRKLLMVLCLLTPLANQARADWNAASASAANNSWYCSQYSDPSQCAADRSCKYDWLYRSCVSSGAGGGNPGGPGGNRACSSYDRDQYLCDQQPNCQYDYNYNRCSDRGQGGGNGQCSRWSNDPFTCNNVPGCGFDTYQRRCVSDYDNGNFPGNGGGNFPGNGGGNFPGNGGGNHPGNGGGNFPGNGGGNHPGNGGHSSTINCASVNYAYQRCPVYGIVTGATLLNEQSYGVCQQGSTWSYDADGLWVSSGCTGNFQVNYNDR